MMLVIDVYMLCMVYITCD